MQNPCAYTARLHFCTVRVELIERQGFGLVEVPFSEREPLVFDWDDEDARLLGATFD
jgi:hypothetical protein